MIIVSNSMKKSMDEPRNGGSIPELLTLMEACEILKCHPNTLRQWDTKGILPAIRIGEKKMRRYRTSDIEKFLRRKK